MAQKMDARWADAYALFEVPVQLWGERTHPCDSQVWEDGSHCRLTDDQRVVDVVLNRANHKDKYKDLLGKPPR